METVDFDLEIAENQIGIDFDNLNVNEEIEQSSVLPQSVIKPVNFDWVKNEVLFVVVRTNKEYLCPDFSSLSLCGKTLTDWVLMAGGGCQKLVINDCEDVLEKVRAINTDKKIIAVFYNDTPLLDKNSFNRIMDYFACRSINFLQLARGIVVKTDFLRNNPSFMSSATGGYEDDGLLIVDTPQTLAYAYKCLNKKILDFHMNNGVIILDENTVFIDADCEIESGVVIYPNNIIEGQSIIGSGCVLNSGNIISNSILAGGISLTASCVCNSKIGQNQIVDAGEKILNEER